MIRWLTANTGCGCWVAVMFEAEFLDFFTQTVTVQASLSKDMYGYETYGTPIPLPCHIEGRMQLFVDKTGEKMACTGRFFTPVVGWLNETYLVNVPDPTAAGGWRQQSIAAITTRYDEDGPHHYVIYYGDLGNRGMSRNA